MSKQISILTYLIKKEKRKKGKYSRAQQLLGKKKAREQNVHQTNRDAHP